MLKKTKQSLMFLMIIFNICIIIGSFLPYLYTNDSDGNLYILFDGLKSLVILIPILSLLFYILTVKVAWVSIICILLYGFFLFIICFAPSFNQGFVNALGGVKDSTGIGYYIMVAASTTAALLSYLRLAIAIAEHVAEKKGD